MTPRSAPCGGLVLAVLSVALAAPTAAQGPPPPDGSDERVTVTPGAQYAKGSLYRAFMGSGYRDLWTTPITVPVADLTTLAGGLTPFDLGGGETTRTLHLRSADGRHYVFRSVDKEPRALVTEFANTPIAAILRDQMSSFHPSGALVVAGLLDAVGILHPQPQLMVVPDDPRLGEWRAEFAGMLVLFEERPDDPTDGGSGFGGSSEIVSTLTLWDRLQEEPAGHVAAQELLKSRLVDLIVGDRDRSTNNHLWARFDDPAGGIEWRVVPRDRDQAFVQFDGIGKALARGHDPRLVPFGDEYPSIEGLTRNAWDIDRQFLVGLSRPQWDATVAEVQSLLTDDVIERAVRRLPPEHYAIVGDEMTTALRHRRDELPKAAEELYGFVFDFPDIRATDGDEVATVERREDGSVRVAIRVVDPDVGITFDRSFIPSETSEIRLYMHGGSDEVRVNGSGPGSIRLRAIGGGGADRFVDSAAHGPNEFYDAGDATEVVGGPGTRFHRRNAPRVYNWLETERELDWGSEWSALPGGGYDRDRGLVLSSSATIDQYGFLKSPYANRTRIELGWSFGLGEPLVDYRQNSRDALFGLDLDVHGRLSGMEVIDYYGLGNETPEVGSVSYHRVAHKQVLFSLMLDLGDGERHRFGVGPVLKYMSTDSTDTQHFIGATDPYGSGRFGQIGVQASVELDGRDRSGTPSSGYLFEGGGAYFPEAMDVDRGAFGEAHGQLATFVSPPGGNPTLALRIQGKKVWGTFPFAESAFLGGASSLRGLREQRYAGEAALLGGAELRLYLTHIVFLLPSDFGVVALTDAGRVYVDGESSDSWRTSWGGGIWLAPLSRGATLQLTAVRSAERTSVYAGVGFAF